MRRVQYQEDRMCWGRGGKRAQGMDGGGRVVPKRVS